LTNEETEELRLFLRDNVSSFEELETLLFLARAPRRAWPVADVAAALSLSDDAIRTAVAGLPSSLLVREEGASAPVCRYAAGPDLQPVVERLLRAYDERRVVILQIMSANAMERVRSAAARHLADAFRLERSKK